ncbi:MAG TPA: hypothetical protein VG388_15530 [Solirubrobacteraceae bacterium]|jgi:hypothetical protein|nr:hypothetical protein [Solirubrobacteraceae bacterium]
MKKVRRNLGVMLILAGVAVPLSVVSLAYACGILATVHLNHSAAAPGASISVIGGNYSSAASASAVTLRFNSRSGNVLWSGRPDSNGSIHATFTVPSASPGYYLIMGTQTTAAGASVAGTPGRAVLHIGGASKAKRGAVALWPSAGTGPGAGSHAISGTTLSTGPSTGTEMLVALASAALLGGGFLVLLGDRRRGRYSAPAAV